MPEDDIRELMGRYATGSLTPEERQRLFNAALEDQELFDELAREDEVKQLLAEPGARERLIHALEPPKPRPVWLWVAAASGVAAAVVAVVLLRPVPESEQQIAAVTPHANAPAGPTVDRAVTPPTGAPASPPPARAVPPPVSAPAAIPPAEPAQAPEAQKPAAQQVEQARTEASEQMAQKDSAQADKKFSGGIVPAAAQRDAVQPVNAAAQAPRAKAAASALNLVPPVAFHYSLDASQLTVLASTAGYLSIKTGEGVVLYAVQAREAGSTVEVPLPGDATSIVVTFSHTADPVAVKPAPRAEASGDVLAPGSAAIELKIHP